MKVMVNHLQRFTIAIVPILFVLLAAGCASSSSTEETALSATESATIAVNETKTNDTHDDNHVHDDKHAHDEEHTPDGATDKLTLPELNAVALNNEPLRVIATTSIIGDVVAQVGQDAIELATLIGPGQDPHSYEPGARELTAVANAHVIFVNGWDLEEGLANDLQNIGESAPVVAISANIDPLTFAANESREHEDEGHDHASIDPHVWFSIHNVEQWVENVAQSLSTLDPANSETYKDNATAYLVELAALEEYAAAEIDQIPAENRFLVTNHDAFGYFAHDYGLTVLGTVIPSQSTLAEPSASDLANLIKKMEEHGVCTIFTETTLSNSLAQTVAAELDSCETVQLQKLNSGALGQEGSARASFIDMFRANVDAVVAGLK